MSILEAVILGLIQGITEFLPVSSSGHMLLAGRFLGLSAVPMAFEIIMHLGTLLALIITLRREFFSIIKRPLSKKTLNIIIACVPTLIIALVFKSFIEAAFTGFLLVPCFLLTAILIIVMELNNKNRAAAPGKMLKDGISALDAAIIGVSQGIAVLPGISRSGATICTAKLLGAKKEDAANFSFLISVPVIVGSSILEIASDPNNLGAPPLALVAGFLAAFVSGLIFCKLMLRLINKHSLDGFAVYLFLLSGFLLLNDFVLHIF